MDKIKVLESVDVEVYSFISVLDQIKQSINKGESKDTLNKKIDEFISVAMDFNEIIPF